MIFIDENQMHFRRIGFCNSVIFFSLYSTKYKTLLFFFPQEKKKKNKIFSRSSYIQLFNWMVADG